LSKLRVITMHG